MSKIFTQNNKILFLTEIRDKKDILFGSFSDKLTKQDKIVAWKEIHNKCAGLGLVAPNKEWSYCRDVLWQNMKEATMKKVDNRRKTGSAGGIDCKFTEIDNIVLDIVGRDNPVLNNLEVPETWEPAKEDQIAVNNNFEKDNTRSSLKSIENKVETSLSNKTAKRLQHIIQDTSDTDSLVLLKKNKLQLQIEILEKENHLKTLQIMQIEKDLQIAEASPFTSHLVTYVIEESPKLQTD